jgi:hypothetical protein
MAQDIGNRFVVKPCLKLVLRMRNTVSRNPRQVGEEDEVASSPPPPCSRLIPIPPAIVIEETEPPKESPLPTSTSSSSITLVGSITPVPVTRFRHFPLAILPSSQKQKKNLEKDTGHPNLPGTKFFLFPLLPAELRQEIWSYALLSTYKPPPHPFSGSKSYDSLYNKPSPRSGRLSWAPLLSVCQESRDEAVYFFEGVKGEEGCFRPVEDPDKRRRGRVRVGDFVREEGERDVRRIRIKVVGWWWDSSIVGQ